MNKLLTAFILALASPIVALSQEAQNTPANGQQTKNAKACKSVASGSKCSVSPKNGRAKCAAASNEQNTKCQAVKKQQGGKKKGVERDKLY